MVVTKVIKPRRRPVLSVCAVLATALLSVSGCAARVPSATTRSATSAVNGLFVGSGNPANMLSAALDLNGVKVQWAGDYAGWEGPGLWAANQWAKIDQPHVLWSVAFLPDIAADKGSNPAGWLAEVKRDMTLAASGAYDQHWVDIGRLMASTSRQGKDAIRIGWELGGEWYPSGSRVFAGAGSLQKQAWQHYATAIRNSGWRVKTVWDSEDISTLPDPRLIDVVNTGGYDGPADGWAGCGAGGHNPDGTWLHPAAVWACSEQGMGPRLQRSADLARAIGKPLAISEWGLSYGNDDTYFIQAMHDFVVTHDVMFAIYFDNDNSNSVWSEMHNLVHFPNGAALYRRLFTQM